MLNPKKLLADRIDLWASGKFEGNAILARIGWRGKIVPVLTFNRAELYLACNKSVPDTLIQILNTELDTMNRDGSSKAMEQRYERWPD